MLASRGVIRTYNPHALSYPPHPAHNDTVKERIQKLLASAGVGSRRNVEEMVRKGRIAVNGRIVTELPVLIEPGEDRIEVDGETVRLRAASKPGKAAGTGRRYYFLLNKPKGVYSTNVAQGAQVRAIDLLPREFTGRVYPVGRLDAESRGLLLLTNDGELTNQLTHPRYGVAKTYRAVVDGSVAPAELERLEKGIWLSDARSGTGFKTGRSRIKIAKRARDKSVLEITVREGRNRQVRRMLAGVGHKVRDLMRIKMGPLTLDRLKPGQVRELTRQEVRALRELAEKSHRPQKEQSALAGDPDDA
jgi:23S rRNA pseudouridine2605 synthase